MNDILYKKIEDLPTQPGVYLMKNQFNKVIYVGKAKNLRNRVRSYFKQSHLQSVKTQFLVKNIYDLELIITGNELEALILECNLIKKYRPKYNILLKDDKTYPYLKLTMSETYPRLVITRRVIKDGSKYYGPYTNVTSLRETLKLLRKIFPLRTCRKLGDRPCLEYHIKHCLAPCANKISPEEYMHIVHDVDLFLTGKSEVVEKRLKEAMEEAAEKLAFEKAAQYRDQLKAIKVIMEKQKIYTGTGDMDVLGLAKCEYGICVQVFQIRQGKMMGRNNFTFPGDGKEDDGEILTSFIQQYYFDGVNIPKEIVIPRSISDEKLLLELIYNRSQHKTSFKVPQKGLKYELLKMAKENAAKYLIDEGLRLKDEIAREAGAVEDLGKALGLKNLPRRMECFDISHIQGSETVASMVVFQDGKPDKSSYRRFKIKSAEGKPDDFKSMREVTMRRYGKKDCAPLPDLIIIDGGKGQLSSAVEIIRGSGHADVPVVGLAKQFEWIFREGESDPVILKKDSPALYLIQQIRDEAHRFAITYHRNLRNKRNKLSLLDNIEGIGPKKRKALYDKFKDLAGIKAAGIAELITVPGINEKLAVAIKRYFENLK